MGQGNGLSPHSTKPLLQPMHQEHHKKCSWNFNWRDFEGNSSPPCSCLIVWGASVQNFPVEKYSWSRTSASWFTVVPSEGDAAPVSRFTSMPQLISNRDSAAWYTSWLLWLTAAAPVSAAPHAPLASPACTILNKSRSTPNSLERICTCCSSFSFSSFKRLTRSSVSAARSRALSRLFFTASLLRSRRRRYSSVSFGGSLRCRLGFLGCASSFLAGAMIVSII